MSDSPVIFYSDQPVLSKGLAVALETSRVFGIVHVCHSLAETTALLEEQDGGLVLLDCTADINLQVLQQVMRACPQAKTVLWAYSLPRELAFQAMQIGVRGILPKSIQVDALIQALRAVEAGELWFERDLLQSFLSGKRVVLTRREGQLVTLLSQGLRNKEIAFSLNITEGTVKVYLSRLFRKLGVSDRFELALFGLKNLNAGYQVTAATARDGETQDRAEPSLMALRSILIDNQRLGSPSPAYHN